MHEERGHWAVLAAHSGCVCVCACVCVYVCVCRRVRAHACVRVDGAVTLTVPPILQDACICVRVWVRAWVVLLLFTLL